MVLSHNEKLIMKNEKLIKKLLREFKKVVNINNSIEITLIIYHF